MAEKELTMRLLFVPHTTRDGHEVRRSAVVKVLKETKTYLYLTTSRYSSKSEYRYNKITGAVEINYGSYWKEEDLLLEGYKEGKL